MSLPAALALVPVLILLNAFFVAAESALVAIRPTQIEALRAARPKSRRAAALAALKSQPGSTLAAIQVGITMVNLMLGYLGEPAVSQVLDYLFHSLTRLVPERVVHALA